MRLTELENFIREVMLTYKGLETCLDKLIDPNTEEHVLFHRISTKAHIGFIEFRLKKDVYWLRRVSNIRNTAGYDNYQYHKVDIDEQGEDDDVNIKFRFFSDMWLETHTVNMNIGGLSGK